MNQMHSNQRLMDKGKSPKLLEVQNLNAWYGAAHILHEVSLNVGRGEVVALMGRNGAGKSTTLKSIAALVPRREGSIRFMGEALEKKASHQIAQRGLGYVPEDRRIFTELTVLENLEVGKQKPRRWPDGQAVPHWTPEKLFALFPNLGEMPERLGGRMSGGEQQMLSVARTLMGQPCLVLLDEPNLVTACNACQFGRGQWTLEEVGFFDPREYPPFLDEWDGLTRLSRLAAASNDLQ